MDIRSSSCNDQSRLPTSGTCGNYMNVPEYETDEILEKNLLIAVRNCGNIDLDGGEGDNINMEDDVRPSDDGPVHRGEQVAHDDDERRPEIPSWE